MIKEFSVVSELKAIREQKSRLSERENELSAPVLSDLELIPVIYEWFKDVLSEMAFPPQAECITQRKKFIFIILFHPSDCINFSSQLCRAYNISLQIKL